MITLRKIKNEIDPDCHSCSGRGVTYYCCEQNLLGTLAEETGICPSCGGFWNMEVEGCPDCNPEEAGY